MFTTTSLVSILHHIRKQTPLIHNITNQVVTQFTANTLLSLGASPAMVNAEEEVQEFVQKSNALVINLGTLSSAQARAMMLASQTAHHHQIPWVLDPVGLTASSYRSQTALNLLKNSPDVIRGNASEIIGLYNLHFSPDQQQNGRGVDSLDSSEHALEFAKKLSSHYHTVISISGETDYVTNGKETVAIHNSHPLLTKITGSGCAATAITGACLAVEKNSLYAATAAMIFLGVAADIATIHTNTPGSLQIALLDELYSLDADKLQEKAKFQIQ